jgi:hypothetical protein
VTSLNVVATGGEVIFDQVYLGLDDGKLVVQMAEAVIVATEAFDLSVHIPVIEVGHGGAEGMKGRGRSVEEGVEPAWERLSGFGE